MRTQTNFIAYWIGRCPAKGCRSILHLDIPMIRETWTETHHNHAIGQSREVTKRCEYAVRRGFFPYQLGLACAAHRKELRFTPVNGRYVEGHVCDGRCMNAIGPNCECSCGGANHGRGHHTELVFDR